HVTQRRRLAPLMSRRNNVRVVFADQARVDLDFLIPFVAEHRDTSVEDRVDHFELFLLLGVLGRRRAGSFELPLVQHLVQVLPLDDDELTLALEKGDQHRGYRLAVLLFLRELIGVLELHHGDARLLLRRVHLLSRRSRGRRCRRRLRRVLRAGRHSKSHKHCRESKPSKLHHLSFRTVFTRVANADVTALRRAAMHAAASPTPAPVSSTDDVFGSSCDQTTSESVTEQVSIFPPATSVWAPLQCLSSRSTTRIPPAGCAPPSLTLTSGAISTPAALRLATCGWTAGSRAGSTTRITGPPAFAPPSIGCCACSHIVCSTRPLSCTDASCCAASLTSTADSNAIAP